MASDATNNDDPSVGLIGSQLQTYRQLIAMGFNASDCATVAQIFGSNLEGAIDFVLNGGMHNLQSQQRQNVKNQDVDEIKDEFVEFRVINPIATKLINGYIRQQKYLKDDIPDVIQSLIVKHLNLYFIKLNYNIYNDPSLQKIQKEYMDKYLVLKENKTLRDIARNLEKSYDYDLYQDELKEYHTNLYAYFVRIWMKFNDIKSIYIVSNRKIDKDKITMDTIDNCENEGENENNDNNNNNNNDRWVEIPCDFEMAKVSDLDLMIADKKEKDYILEIGIEKYQQENKLWPFRNKEFLPNNDDVFINENSSSQNDVILPIGSDSVKWINYLKIGDIVDCKDYQQDKWYECLIRFIEMKDENMMIYIHWIGWNKKWDEPMVANNISRVAKRNTYTKGPHRPRMNRTPRYPTSYPSFNAT